MIITLERHSHNKFGTFGTLKAGEFTCCTVEQDWENNNPNVSCIPNGTYKLETHDSPRHGGCLILVNEDLGIGRHRGDAKRFGCLIHKANLASQLEGCIAPGMSYGCYKNQWSVTSSSVALAKLFTAIPYDSKNTIIISSSFPTFKEF